MAREVRNRHSVTQRDEPVIEMSSFVDETPDISNGTIDLGQQNVAKGSATTPRTSRQLDGVGEIQDFQPEVIPSNSDDRERRRMEFAGRHVQMMAIGTTLQLQY